MAWHGGTVTALRQAAAAAQPDLPERALQMAVAWVVEDTPHKDRYYQSDLAKVIQRAREIADVAGDASAVPFALGSTPLQTLTVKELIRAVEPTVRLLRRHVFGAESAPFSEWSAAVDWLEAEQRAQLPLSEAEYQLREQLTEQLFDTLRRLRALGSRYALDDTAYLRGLWYWREGDTEATPVYARRDPLLTLEETILSMGDATGATAPSLLRHVLVADSPTLARATVRREPLTAVLRVGCANTGMVRRARVVATFNTPDFKLGELRDLAKRILEAWRDARAGEVTEEMQALADVVTSVGGPLPPASPPHARDWWQPVAVEWGRRHPSDAKSPDALRVMYIRFLKRFKKAVPSWAHSPPTGDD